MHSELVKNWMTRDVVIIPSHTSLHEARRLMREYRIRRLPVVDDGELVGIVTWGDIRGALPSEATTLSAGEIHFHLSKTRIKEIMTPRPVAIAQFAAVGEAARLMLNKKISALPVIDMAGNVIGILTESDVFRLAVHFGTEADEVVPPAQNAPWISAVTTVRQPTPVAS